MPASILTKEAEQVPRILTFKLIVGEKFSAFIRYESFKASIWHLICLVKWLRRSTSIFNSRTSSLQYNLPWFYNEDSISIILHTHKFIIGVSVKFLCCKGLGSDCPEQPMTWLWWRTMEHVFLMQFQLQILLPHYATGGSYWGQLLQCN